MPPADFPVHFVNVDAVSHFHVTLLQNTLHQLHTSADNESIKTSRGGFNQNLGEKQPQ